MIDSEEIFITEADFRKRYEYIPSDLLGEGGFAQVYKAFDKQFSEYVALKFYNKEQKGKYDVLHEMKNLRSFSHKNVIRVHDAFVVRYERAGTYSFVQVGVLEYANGGNLHNFIETKPSENVFIEVLLGILEGLKYLHGEKNIIHRDLSPENILMCLEEGKWIPKISDFGISKKIEIDSLVKDQKQSTQLIGKIEYMAPEQFCPEKYGIDGNINTNVDLWAFGIILYELFNHVTPFVHKTTESPLSAINSIINNPVPVLDDIPFPYRKVIERCLIKNAGKRANEPAELISIMQSGVERQASKYKNTLPLKDIKSDRINLKRIGIVAAICLLFAGTYLITWNISKKKSEKAISEISTLMNNQQYLNALNVINGLSRRMRGTPEISNLYSVCRIQQAEDSVSNYLSARQFSRAINYLASLEEDVRSDTALMDVSGQTFILHALDSLNRFALREDFEAGIQFYQGMEPLIKKRPEAVLIYRELRTGFTVDSVLNEGRNLFRKKLYKHALGNFRLVSEKYDPGNIVADSMIKIIESLSFADSKVIMSTIPAECYYAGKNLMTGQQPDIKEVKLISVCFTSAQEGNEMVITLEIQHLDFVINIADPKSDNAFFIEYNKGAGVLNLTDVRGLKANTEYKISRPTKIDLVFAKLPSGIKRFDLLEGKNFQDPGRWDFMDIQLISK